MMPEGNNSKGQIRSFGLNMDPLNGTQKWLLLSQKRAHLKQTQPQTKEQHAPACLFLGYPPI